MRLLISRLKGLTELFVLAMLLMVGVGGQAVAGWYTSPEGSSGGFTGRPLITVEISADKTSVPVNLAGLAPNPALPYTSTITVAVKQDGRLFPTSIQLDLAPSLASGALFDPEDSTQGFRSLPLASTSGLATTFFHASSTPGDVTITASAQDPNTGQAVSASLKITVVGESRPATSMMFTGPYVNAVLAGVSRFGTEEATIQDGSYSRVVSVVVNDVDGRPTNPNTQVNFYMIDGPLTPDSYPNNPGAFLVAGNNGVPQVNGLNFNAASGQFLTKGVRPLDRLILDGGQMHTVQTVTSETSLGIQSIKPFGADSRSTIPYVIGRANNATILSPSFTNLSGVADTIVTYPVTRVGQTAILVACVAGLNTCTALNTCDINGANCKSVFLGVTNGTDVTLTTSATELGPNTTTPVKLCLKDPNFTPLPATEIRYDMSATGISTVKINDKEGKQGSIMTGADGCATAQIATTGQPPGSKDIVLTFSADNVLTPVQVTVKGPGEGKIDGIASCQITNPGTNTTDPITPPTAACTVEMMVVDDNFSPLSGILITMGDGSAEGEITVSFSPAEGNYGKTDEKGAVTASMTFRGAGAYSIPFKILNGTATFTVNFNLPAPTDAPEEPVDPEEPDPLTIATTTIPAATADIFYTALLQAAGGTSPYTWTILSGTLPAGITLGSSTGVISGTPSVPGTFNLVIQVRDSAGQTALQNLSLVVASSGGGGGGSAKASNLTLLVSSPDLPSSGQQPVTLTAIARDSKGILLKDASVQFAVKSTDTDGTTPNGTIQVISNVTDDTGTATATLSTGGNQRNRIITVGASSGTVNAPDVTVNVTGTVLTVTGVDAGASVLVGDTSKLIFELKNSAGTGISGATLDVSSRINGLAIPPATSDSQGSTLQVTTNSSGVAEVNLKINQNGQDTVTGVWNGSVGTTVTLQLSASSDKITISVVDNNITPPRSDVIGIDPVLGGDVTVTWTSLVNCTDPNGCVVSPADISLITTKGTLVITNPGGNPLKGTISSDVPGGATLTATGKTTRNGQAVTVTSAPKSIQFVATTPQPTKFIVQANPSTIPVNVPPATASQSTITAVVRDANDNPVPGILVSFKVTKDPSGGVLNSATATTDFSGQASVVYFAGSSATPEKGVVIEASVTSPISLTATTALTVSQREVFITLGTGNTITEPNSTTYALPYNVLVTDIVGGAVQGAVVNLNAVPSQYRKGQYFWNGVVWVPVVTVGCPNEDVNGNGVLDTGEDTNTNGRLDPGNAVTTSVASIVTDKDGFGDFDVLYAQQYASWINNTLTARTKVGGSEDEELSSFVLPPSAGDVGNVSVSPPGQPSPFGVLPKCELSVEREAGLTLAANPTKLDIAVGASSLGPLITTTPPDTVTISVNLPPPVIDLTGTTVFASSDSVNVNLEITHPSSVITTGSQALFSVTVTNTSTTQSVPVPATVGTITFEVGDAKVVVPVNLIQ